MKVLFATTNPAKIKNYASRLIEKGYEIITLKDLKIDIDVEETGATPLENAIIKAKGYYKISNIPTIAIDEGLYLDGIPKHLQPGTHVRRVNGKKLTDEEMITHYINLVNEYGSNGKLTGYFQKGIAILNDNQIDTIEIKAPRCFSDTRCETITPGYPLASIQWVEELNKYKAELTKDEENKLMSKEQKQILDFIESKIDKN